MNHTPLDGDLPTLVSKLVNDIAGMGFLTDYIEDASVEEIIMNGIEQLWVMRANGAKGKVNLLEPDLDHDRVLDHTNRTHGMADQHDESNLECLVA